MNNLAKFGMTLQNPVLEKMDEVRGDIPRTKYILRLIEKALNEPQLQQNQVLHQTRQEEGGITAQN